MFIIILENKQYIAVRYALTITSNNQYWKASEIVRFKCLNINKWNPNGNKNVITIKK